MKAVESLRNWATIRQNIQCDTTSIGFVPTMGALHDGHLSLIKQSQLECDITVVSIFLNPTQFNNENDLASYPSSLEQDFMLLKNLDVNYVITPSYKEIYPNGYLYKVTETEKSKSLCGADRPGHFDGVLTVVMKLFNIVKPHKAFFGEKDHQQLELIQGMVKDFFLNIEIIPCATVRELNGLAMSSRNKKLSLDQKLIAPGFFEALSASASDVQAKQSLLEKGFHVDYVIDQNGRRYGAVQLGDTRLIDNVQI